MPFLLALMGPTASGKTDLAERLAERFGAQLVNADAFQVYRGMDIGTGKPSDKVKYKLLDIAEPWEQFGVGAWVRLAADALGKIWSEGRPAIVVGGSGLYVRALFEGYDIMGAAPDPDTRRQLMEEEQTFGVAVLFERLRQLDPEAAGRVDSANPRRVLRALEKALCPSPPIRLELPPFQRYKIGIDPPAEVLIERIEHRLDHMLASGWVDEVRRLRGDAQVKIDSPGMKAIGYRTLWEFLDGATTLEEARGLIGTATRQYAKRQRTWLRSEPGLETLEWGAGIEGIAGRLVSGFASK